MRWCRSSRCSVTATIAEIGRKPVQPWQNVHRRGSDCRAGRIAAGRRHAPVRARSGDRRRRRHGAPAGQCPTHDRRDLHRQRADRARRSHRAAPGAPLERLRHHRRAAAARIRARRRRSRARRRSATHRAARLPPAHARRADPFRRRVDGQARPRAEGAREARREPGVPSRGAAPRQADVVWRLAIRARRVRAARQSGLDAGVPVALRAAGAARRDGPGARRKRRASRSPRRSK